MKKIITRFTLFILAIGFQNNSYAQWTQIGYLTTGVDTASSVGMFAGFGGNMYAASNKGLYRSTDNGNTWSSLTYSAATTASINMVSVFEESVTTIYTGSDKRLYKSTNGGSSWTWLPLPMDSVTVTDIQRSGNHLLVSYNKNFTKGGVYYSADNGSTWNTAVGLPATLPIFDLHVEGDTVYVAGQGGVKKSTDKGVTFGAAGSGMANSRTMTRHSGNLFAGDGGGTGLYVSTNNSNSWAPANASVFAGFCQIFCIAQVPGMIVAAVDGGTVCNGGNPVKASVDGGVNWAPFMTGLAPGSYAKLGTNSAFTSFFTNKSKIIYRTGLASGIKQNTNSQEVKAFFDGDGDLVLNMSNNTNALLSIYSVNGALIYKGECTGNEVRVTDIKNATPGLYTLIISAQNQTRKCKVLKTE